MMTITQRQKEILNDIIQEYVKSAQPVSSGLLEKKYKVEVSPATIRNEMQKLTDAGFIHQPHTSAGRIPTDKGYRFFVNELLERGTKKTGFDLDVEKLFQTEMENTFRFAQSLTKELAEVSSALAMSYLPEERILCKDGWEEILQEPEFKEKSFVSEFTDFLKDFENELGDIKLNSECKVYIGRENPYVKTKGISLIISKCSFPKKEKGVLGIVGPKRMAYDRNISIINSLTRLMEKI